MSKCLICKREYPRFEDGICDVCCQEFGISIDRIKVIISLLKKVIDKAKLEGKSELIQDLKKRNTCETDRYLLIPQSGWEELKRGGD